MIYQEEAQNYSQLQILTPTSLNKCQATLSTHTQGRRRYRINQSGNQKPGSQNLLLPSCRTDFSHRAPQVFQTWSHRRWNSLWHRLRIGRFVFAHFFCRKREKKSFCSKKCAIKRAGLDLAINSRYCYIRSWISASHTGLLLIPIHNLNIELCIHALRSRLCTILYTGLVVAT